MGFLEWWNEYGSRLHPTQREDWEQFTRRVAAEAFAAGVERGSECRWCGEMHAGGPENCNDGK